jgi:lipoyl(octanoyl) transferase
MTGTPVLLHRPGLISYAPALAWQERSVRELREGGGPERLALLQHRPVYTKGRRTRREHLLVEEEALRGAGADVVDVDRGGDVTFHGPGQLVGYPILDLRRRRLLPGDYVRALEQVLIDALDDFGTCGERVAGRPGVWAGGGKMAAIGVRVRGGVSSHGFALNVSTDLSWFDAIVPCGLKDAGVSLMASSMGSAPSMEAVEAAVCTAFARIFECHLMRDEATVVADAASMEARLTHGR